MRQCSGEQSVSAIIALLALEFQSDAAVLEPEVLAFVQSLLDRGLLQAEP